MHTETSYEFYIPRLRRIQAPYKVPLPRMAEILSEIPEANYCELVADDGETFLVCEERLMTFSEFFRAMLNSSMTESRSCVVKIREIMSKNLEQIASACNHAEITLGSCDQILELLALSEQFLMPEFKLDLLSFLETLPMQNFSCSLGHTLEPAKKLLGTISIIGDEEKRGIATWLVNNWDDYRFCDKDLLPFLDFFQYYL